MVLSTLTIDELHVSPRGGRAGATITVPGSGFGSAAGVVRLDPLGENLSAAIVSWVPNQVVFTVPTLVAINRFVTVEIQVAGGNDAISMPFWATSLPTPPALDYAWPSAEAGTPNESADNPRIASAADFNRLQDRANAGGGGGGVPTTRNVGTTPPLMGGGDLSVDRVIGVAPVNANEFLAGPAVPGPAATPNPRLMVLADLPALASGDLTDGASLVKRDGSVPFAADESMGGHHLTNVAAPSVSGDAANKGYVDGLSSVSGAFAFTGIISPTSLSASQDDYNPAGLAGASALRLTSSVDVNITGLAGGAAGRRILIHNIGGSTITLKNSSGSSLAANRFLFDADVALAPNQSIIISYDPTTGMWRNTAAASGGGGGGGGGTITGQFLLTGVISPTILGGDQADYNPTGLSGASTLRLSSSLAVILSGIVGGVDGRVLIIHNVGANLITLANNVSSIAGNRFLLGQWNVDLQPDQSIALRYDGTTARWRAVVRDRLAERVILFLGANQSIPNGFAGATAILWGPSSIEAYRVGIGHDPNGPNPERFPILTSGVYTAWMFGLLSRVNSLAYSFSVVLFTASGTVRAVSTNCGLLSSTALADTFDPQGNVSLTFECNVGDYFLFSVSQKDPGGGPNDLRGAASPGYTMCSIVRNQ